MTQLDAQCVNTIRFLAADQVEQAKSGHPGMPLGAAPMAFVLFDRILKFDPAQTDWADRDRFVLSAGHGSALLYSLLHLYGYDLPLAELKRFRQWGSKTPGHPEYGEVPGVEATTGPLGQGFAMGVGMAAAEAHLAAVYNRAGHEIVDHTTYAIAGDGDLMEGISYEATALAGHWKLGKLVYLWDDNHISIEGETSLAWSESVPARFEAAGWHVQRVEDGENIDAIETAVRAAKAETGRPSLVCVRTHIGYGSPKQDMAKAHGEPLGAEAMRATREKLGWPAETFHIPDEVLAHTRQALARGKTAREAWETRFAAYAQAHPDLAARLLTSLARTLPEGWESALPVFAADAPAIATRAASGKVLNALAQVLPGLLGGSADLGPSNDTTLQGIPDFSAKSYAGRNFHFGVREHAMAAIVNGMALHGGLLPYGATFLIFSDYMRPSLRLASLMKAHSIWVFTHDSVAVGEDGPTHQPIDQLASLRAIPGFQLFRPADANETSAAWRCAIEAKGPVALALSRQNLPVLDSAKYPIKEGVPRGAYILVEAEGAAPQAVVVATGAEVHLALEARELLTKEGLAVRVVSAPCLERFRAAPEGYRAQVLPAGVPTLAVEAASPLGWHEFADTVIGIERFGASAPGGEVLKRLGFTAEIVAERARSLVKG